MTEDLPFQTASGQDGEATARRKRRKRDPEGTKAKLLQAAKREFALEGLEGARVRRIASRARVNKQLVYHYFGNKEQLYVTALEDAYGQFRQRDVVDVENQLPEKAIALLVGSIFDGIVELEDVVALIVDANRNKGRHVRGSARIRSLHEPLIRSIHDVLRKGEKLGKFDRNIDPVRFFISVLGMCSIVISNGYTLSAVLGRDLRDPAEMQAWRTYVIRAALKSVSKAPVRP